MVYDLVRYRQRGITRRKVHHYRRNFGSSDELKILTYVLVAFLLLFDTGFTT